MSILVDSEFVHLNGEHCVFSGVPNSFISTVSTVSSGRALISPQRRTHIDTTRQNVSHTHIILITLVSSLDDSYFTAFAIAAVAAIWAICGYVLHFCTFLLVTVILLLYLISIDISAVTECFCSFFVPALSRTFRLIFQSVHHFWWTHIKFCLANGASSFGIGRSFGDSCHREFELAQGFVGNQRFSFQFVRRESSVWWHLSLRVESRSRFRGKPLVEEVIPVADSDSWNCRQNLINSLDNSGNLSLATGSTSFVPIPPSESPSSCLTDLVGLILKYTLRITAFFIAPESWCTNPSCP